MTTYCFQLRSILFIWSMFHYDIFQASLLAKDIQIYRYRYTVHDTLVRVLPNGGLTYAADNGSVEISWGIICYLS